MDYPFFQSGERGPRSSWLFPGPGAERPVGFRPRRPRSLKLYALLTALLVALAALVVPGVASAALPDFGDQGPSHTGTLEPTGTKRATSALWFNDGSWWGNLWDTASQDFHIFKFNATTKVWADTGVVTETRADTHHDVLWDGNTLYVASYRVVKDGLPAQTGSPTTMRRYSYNPTTDKYTLLGSEKINDNKVETLTIDKDSKGRLWATWQEKNRIYINVTATDGKTWGTTPFPHPASVSNVSVDDTSAVIAFDGNKIGVMWSRQLGDATDGMYWSYHVDGAATTEWSTPVAAVKGQRIADDHMNLKWLDAAAGGVFAAVKTSFTSAAQPLIQLLVLKGTTWTSHTIATVAECPNRVIVLIDEFRQQIRTFATYPKSGTGITNAGVCTSSGGAIYEKSTSLSNISFSTAKTKRIMDADQYVHNVTSTKQNLNNDTNTANSGVLVLADVNATKTYWHFYEEGPGGTGGGTADTTPPTVTATTPTSGATNVAVNSNVTATFSEAMDQPSVTIPGAFTLTAAGATTPVGATVTYNSTSRVATLDPTSDLTAGTQYTARIKGPSGVKDVAGNTMAADKTWSFTTASATTPPPTGTPETVTVTATADTYASSASPTTNFGTSTMLGVDFSPVEVAYLKFSLPAAPSGKTLQSATLQLKSAGSGSTGKQNVKLVADDTWTETGITSNSRPALGASLGTLGPTSVNTDYNVVLDAAAVGGELGQPLSLGLDSASSDGLDLNSRETASPPKLVLTFQ